MDSDRKESDRMSNSANPETDETAPDKDGLIWVSAVYL
jgi:hypothetical protein